MGRPAQASYRPARRLVQPRPCRSPARGGDGAAAAATRSGLAAGVAGKPAQASRGHGPCVCQTVPGAGPQPQSAHRCHGDRGAAAHEIYRRHVARLANPLPPRALRVADGGRQPRSVAGLECVAEHRPSHVLCRAASSDIQSSRVGRASFPAPSSVSTARTQCARLGGFACAVLGVLAGATEP